MDEPRTHSPSPVAEAAERRPDLTDVLRWHGGWAGALAFAAVVLWLTAPWTRSAGFALAIDAAPALGFFIARNYDGPRLRTGLLIAWTAAGAAAAVLTGGLASPLAVWCLAPLVASVLLGGRHRLAQGAALAVVAVAVTALAQAAGLVGVQPTGPLSFGLGFTGLATTASGAAFGLLLKRGDAEAAPAVSTATDDATAILDAQPYLILVLDRAGQVLRAFGHAPTGIDGQALRGGGLVKLVGGGDYLLFREALADAARDGTARFGFRRNGAEGVSLMLEVARLPDDRLAATLRDVSADRAREAGLENAVEEAQSLAAGRARFLANMSHELRTPLNAIMGFSDIMRERIFGELSPKYGEYADLIHDAGAHLLDLINDVLDMSKIEADKYELKLDRLDAREPVSAGLRLMRGQADDLGVTLRGVLPPQPLEVDADGRALKQIVLNLISNALKFTPRGGLVTVSLSTLAGAMELSVADSGIGISAADLERLGKPYEQAGDASQQAKGTGLGLSLVRAFAELHGGEMVIESRLGEGAAVTVRLPVLAPETEALAGGRTVTSAGGDGGARVIAASAFKRLSAGWRPGRRDRRRNRRPRNRRCAPDRRPRRRRRNRSPPLRADRAPRGSPPPPWGSGRRSHRARPAAGAGDRRRYGPRAGRRWSPRGAACAPAAAAGRRRWPGWCSDRAPRRAPCRAGPGGRYRAGPHPGSSRSRVACCRRRGRPGPASRRWRRSGLDCDSFQTVVRTGEARTAIQVETSPG